MLRRPASLALPLELRLLSSLQPSRRSVSTLRPGFRRPLVSPVVGSQESLGARRVVPVGPPVGLRAFHATSRRDVPAPLALLALLKSSTILASVTTLSRVLISLMPLPLMVHLLSGKRLRHHKKISDQLQASDEAWRLHDQGFNPPKDAPASLRAELDRIRHWEDKRERLLLKQSRTARVIWTLVLVPLVAFAAAVAAGLERTPVSGRWRVILLSPQEEETLHEALATGWFEHVLSLLKPTPESPPPRILPPEDWRWSWVESTLRALERGAEACYVADAQAHGGSPSSPKPPSTDAPFPPPPPPPYPLQPRPRMSHMLHHALPPPSSHPVAPPTPAESERALLGPPFSLLLLDAPDANAFSYGFGDDGAAGIVVNTGILDEILGTTPSANPPPAIVAPSRSWLSYLVPGLSTGRPESSAPAFVPPSEEQTLHLAVVLAHEVSHLLLTHHLESLSQRQILLPSAVNFSVDIVRTILYPFTALLGPIVNDAIGALSRTGLPELSQLGSNCSNQRLEIEADLVALRLLAHSQFNPYEAARFWLPNHPPTPSTDQPSTSWGSAWRTLSYGFGLSHPSNEARSEAVRRELAAWRKAWTDTGRKAAAAGGT